MSQNDLVYLEALKASETSEAPGIGLTTSSDKLSIPSGVKTLIRQNKNWLLPLANFHNLLSGLQLGHG